MCGTSNRAFESIIFTICNGEINFGYFLYIDNCSWILSMEFGLWLVRYTYSEPWFSFVCCGFKREQWVCVLMICWERLRECGVVDEWWSLCGVEVIEWEKESVMLCISILEFSAALSIAAAGNGECRSSGEELRRRTWYPMLFS